MCSWNQYIIEKNINKIRNKLLISKEKDDIISLRNAAEVYIKMDKLMLDVIEKEGDNFIYPPPFLADKDIDLSENDIYHSITIEKISNFLKEFNPEYYYFFNDMAKKGLISLHKNDDGINISEHFIDPINKTSFIYVSSNSLEEENELIKQFGYVYQIVNNEIPYDESKVLVKDAFPEYLLMSMKSFYNDDLKDSLIKEKYSVIDKLIIEQKAIEGDSESKKEERKEIGNKIGSNYMAIFMFENNDIECSFKNVDEFIRRNNNNEGNKSRVLWQIANDNIEGIDHVKEHVVLKNKIKEKTL